MEEKKEEKKTQVKRLTAVQHLRAALNQKTSAKQLPQVLALLDELNKKFAASKAELEEKRAKADKALQDSGLSLGEFVSLMMLK